MSETTKIGWTNTTWMTVTGCTRVSEGCRHCYAERQTATSLKEHLLYAGLAVMNNGEPRWSNEVRCHEDQLHVPLHWRNPRMVFVNSMSDTFHEDVPFSFIDRMFAVMALCPQHTFQILTKRPKRMAEYLVSLAMDSTKCDRITEIAYTISPFLLTLGWIGKAIGHPGYGDLYERALPNVWTGCSCEDQATLDERVPHLLATPAAVRFLSLEPLLGPVNLHVASDFSSLGHGPSWMLPLASGSGGFTAIISWVIVGGESGPGFRLSKIEWIESVVAQCRAAGLPCFVKQDSGLRPGMQGRLPNELWAVKQFPLENP